MGLTKPEGQMLVNIVTSGGSEASRNSAIKQLEKHSPSTIVKLKKKGLL